MHFNRLDEIYTMVQSNWYFDIVTQTGLTGLYDRSDQFAQIVQQTQYLPILSVNNTFYLLVFGAHGRANYSVLEVIIMEMKIGTSRRYITS